MITPPHYFQCAVISSNDLLTTIFDGDDEKYNEILDWAYDVYELLSPDDRILVETIFDHLRHTYYENGVIPVSYTHLTLPTKRIV